MSFLRRMFGGDDSPTPPVLDVEQRTAQLRRLERALDALVEQMTANGERMTNPGWRERVAEYKRLSGEAYRLRSRPFTREEILDLVFEVRPAFTGDRPADVEPIRPAEDELMAAAEALRGVLPGERPG